MARDKSIIKKLGIIADKIIALEEHYSNFSDEQLRAKTDEFKQRIQENSESVDDILVDAYAVVREAAWRVLKLKAYRVQLIGGIILNSGDIAEMRTGEGKTLTGLFPAYLNSLTGKGVHIVTVNEYLSQRDSEINGQVYNFLGVTVGLNGRGLSKDQKRQAYAQDVTYTTNSEIGFDYLRDNMVYSFGAKVQRGLNFAIIDEADSVLIDEARTPLIISGGSSNRANMYQAADQFAKTLKQTDDFDIDLETKQVYLNDIGMEKANKFFSVKNLFDVKNTELFHLIMNALKANFTFKEGVEYAAQNNEIVLIDQFTGRIMEGRSYSDGLQQALQAKEGVAIEEETATLATITYQNFYRLYSKLSGMTGTAKTEEEEFIKIYNTRVVVTPTNKPIIRKDEIDLTYATKNAALKSLIIDLKELNELGRPVLIGTTSVESSEQIERYLSKAGLKFEMINAKNHNREAEIVEKAGQRGAITLATNMAGRGTDIKLTEETRQLGGLFVFGVERNEARRIDNQLRGRSGRQGDPGNSRFYISMEDELMVRFTAPKVRQMFLRLGDEAIKSAMFTRAITNAQKKLEGLNFDQRKNVLDYDNVLAQHREAIYSQRDEILKQEDLKLVLSRFQYTTAFELVLKNSELVRGESTINAEMLIAAVDNSFVKPGTFKKSDFAHQDKVKVAKMISDAMMEFYKERIDHVPDEVSKEIERRTILQSLDKFWTRHINLANKLRSGIYLQQYAQNNPLHEYIEEAARLFNKMKIDTAAEVIENLSQVVIREEERNTSPMASRNNRPVIEISEKDIDKILTDINLSKDEFTRENVQKRFEELIKEASDNKNDEATKKLLFQQEVLKGLMNEIDRVRSGAGSQSLNVNLSQKDVEVIFKKFGFKPGDEVDTKKVESKFKKLSAAVDKDANPKELQRLLFEKEVILNVGPQIAKAKKEFVVEDNSGNIKKKIKTSGIDIDDVDDSEQVQSKSKIG
ncbi:preprotein translocase subunit SecA [Spiroplasma sabaudiense Ar-1343]|uniref:Protein translocase subunit SecA n=1 Tax=Spiroplasma sabaudiense Ar-1343 TaxID=1276257 RepID=W6A929_9MOLU|nr:preprotein translocase subunit SecA [Spiroplasma sabaudiense]AHI53471.1 preprotein translocase subunit SecA [Spiroplasma sabaudiense Ar-1343]